MRFPPVAHVRRTDVLSQNDPTDHALAAIASLHQPEGHREPEAAPIVEDKPLAPAMDEADGYSKVGPGPIAAIRFKWTVRRDDDGHFYVDETIGENSAPIVNGPMSGEAAVRLVDARESDASLRFEQLKNEMTGGVAAAGPGRSDGGEV
jgi:hypothetical protein